MLVDQTVQFATCTSPIMHLISPNILHNLCFPFLLCITAAPREIENTAYAKCLGATRCPMGDVQWRILFSQNLHKKRVQFPTEGNALGHVYVMTGQIFENHISNGAKLRCIYLERGASHIRQFLCHTLVQREQLFGPYRK